MTLEDLKQTLGDSIRMRWAERISTSDDPDAVTRAALWQTIAAYTGDRDINTVVRLTAMFETAMVIAQAKPEWAQAYAAMVRRGMDEDIIERTVGLFMTIPIIARDEPRDE